MSDLMKLQCGCGRERKIHSGLGCGPLLPTDKEPELTYRELKERLEKCEAALNTIAHGIGMDHLKPKDVPGVMQDVARAALEE